MKQESQSKFKSPFWQSFLATLVFGLLLAGLFIYSNNHAKTADELFYGALDKQLQTPNIYRNKEVSQDGASQSQTTVINLNNKKSPVSASYISVKKTTPGQESDVAATQVGTQDADYLQYTKYTGEDGAKFQKVLGQWAVNKASDGQPAQSLTSAIFDSPIMTGSLNRQTRNEIMAALQQSNGGGKAIEVLGAPVKYSENGKTYYKYNAEINLKYYVPIFQKYLNSIGLSSAADQLTAPEADQKVKITVVIDPATGQIVKTINSDDNSGPSVSFVPNKFALPAFIPQNVKMTFQNLQQAILGK